MNSFINSSVSDPIITQLIHQEEQKQRYTLKLIPSENYTSKAVLNALGSVFTNKYSEGYAHKRYYEGQINVDAVETLCIERACTLFGVEHANVQPYSGSPANLAVYFAFCQPNDPIMGLALPMGGHLTHGWPVTISGKYYHSISYGVDPKTECVDMNQVWDLATKHRPKLLFCGGSAIPRTVDFPAFHEVAKKVGALLVADIAHIAGLIVGGAHPSPVGFADIITTTTHKTLRGPRGGMILCSKEFGGKIDRAVFPGLQGGPHNNTTAALAIALKEASQPSFHEYANQVVRNAKELANCLIEYGYRLVSGGTDNHLILINLTDEGVSGKQVAHALEQAGLEVNYNTIPYDLKKPTDPSGIRLGTPAITSRGMKEKEMKKIANFFHQALQAYKLGHHEKLALLKQEVSEFCDGFKVPGLDD